MELQTTAGSITLRPIHLRDDTAFQALRLQALQEHPEVYGSDYSEQANEPLEYWQDRIQRTLGSEYQALFVTEASGQLVAMTGIFRETGPKQRHYATIYGVYVDPGWRGNRITDHLIALCLEWARNHAVSMARLSVVISNTSAIRCYARCGFTVYGIEPAVICHNGVYYDELLMGRRV